LKDRKKKKLTRNNKGQELTNSFAHRGENESEPAGTRGGCKGTRLVVLIGGRESGKHPSFMNLLRRGEGQVRIVINLGGGKAGGIVDPGYAMN